jgi:hypothetical protein
MGVPLNFRQGALAYSMVRINGPIMPWKRRTKALTVLPKGVPELRFALVETLSRKWGVFLGNKNPQSVAVKGVSDGVPGSIRTGDAGIRRTALGCLGCRSDAPKSLSIHAFGVACIYAVALEIPVPSLRGDAVVTDAMRRSRDQTTSRGRGQRYPKPFRPFRRVGHGSDISVHFVRPVVQCLK